MCNGWHEDCRMICPSCLEVRGRVKGFFTSCNAIQCQHQHLATFLSMFHFQLKLFLFQNEVDNKSIIKFSILKAPCWCSLLRLKVDQLSPLSSIAVITWWLIHNACNSSPGAQSLIINNFRKYFNRNLHVQELMVLISFRLLTWPSNMFMTFYHLFHWVTDQDDIRSVCWELIEMQTSPAPPPGLYCGMRIAWSCLQFASILLFLCFPDWAVSLQYLSLQTLGGRGRY